MARPLVAYIRCGKDDDYLYALEAADIDVRVVDPEGDPGRALVGVQGVVLAGGHDLDPSRYGEDLHPSCELAGTTRDTFELAVARHCLETGLPLLAICRGMQVLNVAAGGSLIQDLPSQVPTAILHAITDTPTTMAHELEVFEGTHLAQAIEAGMSDEVNSRHHQAAKMIGNGLIVSAHAPDGLVEGIEAPDLPFCVGVQWHPENYWQTGEFRPLFNLFATACLEREATLVTRA